jgi:hypothetical protein
MSLRKEQNEMMTVQVLRPFDFLYECTMGLWVDVMRMAAMPNSSTRMAAFILVEFSSRNVSFASTNHDLPFISSNSERMLLSAT